MLKAVLVVGSRRVLLIGLSGENMTRLMSDEPIPLDAAELGFSPLPIIIVGGRTEDAIQAHVTEAGGQLGAMAVTAADGDQPSSARPGPADYAAATAVLQALPRGETLNAANLAEVVLNAVYAARANVRAAGRSYTCPRCLATSHNSNDAVHGYCGACHDFTGAHASPGR